jgi:hypothetical protein
MRLYQLVAKVYSRYVFLLHLLQLLQFHYFLSEQCILSSGRDLNPGPTDYDGVLTIRLRLSVSLCSDTFLTINLQIGRWCLITYWEVRGREGSCVITSV